MHNLRDTSLATYPSPLSSEVDTVLNERYFILGIQNVRLAVNGATLRSARNVSMTVFGGGTGSVSLTLAVMQFGQFINHDMESTAQFAFCNNFSKFVQCFKVIIEI